MDPGSAEADPVVSARTRGHGRTERVEAIRDAAASMRGERPVRRASGPPGV